MNKILCRLSHLPVLAGRYFTTKTWSDLIWSHNNSILKKTLVISSPTVSLAQQVATRTLEKRTLRWTQDSVRETTLKRLSRLSERYVIRAGVAVSHLFICRVLSKWAPDLQLCQLARRRRAYERTRRANVCSPALPCTNTLYLCWTLWKVYLILLGYVLSFLCDDHHLRTRVGY
jgi:hypothetical protein